MLTPFNIRYLLIAFIACISNTLSIAQDSITKRPFSIDAKVHYGFIIPHSEGMEYLIKGHIPAFEINYNRYTLGERQWEKIYRSPEWGITIFYADLANPEQLGVAYGCAPFMHFPLVTRNKFRFFFRLGAGVGWITRPFERTENYKNNAIGSSLNIFAGSSLEGKWNLNQKSYLLTGLSLTHFSNGAWKTPNLGINISTINLGWGYNIQPIPEYKRDSLSPFSKKLIYSFVAAAGLQEIYPIGGKKYDAYTAFFEVQKNISHKSRLGMGADFFYNPSLVSRLAKDSIYINKNSEIIQYGIHLSYELIVGKLSLMLHKGIYLHSKFKEDGIFYHRIGAKYAINKHVFANLSLKTTFFKAEYLEWGMGYKW